MTVAEQSRVETARDKVKGRTGACVCCACEAFEGVGMEDGFQVCVCKHTQWGHNPPGFGRARNGDTLENTAAIKRHAAQSREREKALEKGVKS